MYKNLNSAEGKYLIYLISNISDLEKNYEEVIKDRDFKLKLILYKEYNNFKNQFTNKINQIKLKVDNLNLSNLDSKEMDKIASDLNDLIDYFENKTEFKYVVDNS